PRVRARSGGDFIPVERGLRGHHGPVEATGRYPRNAPAGRSPRTRAARRLPLDRGSRRSTGRNSFRVARPGYGLTDRRTVRRLLPALRSGPLARVLRHGGFLGAALEAPAGLVCRPPDPGGLSRTGEGARRGGTDQPASRLGGRGPSHRAQLPGPGPAVPPEPESPQLSPSPPRRRPT